MDEQKIVRDLRKIASDLDRQWLIPTGRRTGHPRVSCRPLEGPRPSTGEGPTILCPAA